MKVLYKILYKNGVEDEFEQIATEKEIDAFNDVLYQTLQNGMDSVMTLGDAKVTGHFIRGKDITRTTVTILEE